MRIHRPGEVGEPGIEYCGDVKLQSAKVTLVPCPGVQCPVERDSSGAAGRQHFLGWDSACVGPTD